ncbi:hypothetical protein GCM10007301_47840 [Azorhizobium oxalatiphilum]|uniref:DUF1376 domain-containing protein n=1 Tax=Azorhizobium oxalatiphilum TaxID=980631 RepID=A0A917FID7_9HYPH|nr:DUF1376 domain-containing protein [Azorhizobium oxalatiphilum]GGF82151.1 hypothetical protein GCM10007301_47840 [Azorhizobium oxalatiphilum]
MSKLPMLPLFTDAFLADTGHLTAQETGAYLVLLMVAWRTDGCCLPDDDVCLARWARVSSKTWGRIKPRVMAFWSLSNGRWTQKRLTKEHLTATKKAEVARSNGERGGRPKSLENRDALNPVGLPNGTQQKATISISNKTPVVPKRGRVEADTAFEDFRSAYPKRDGGQDWQKAAERFARLVKNGVDPQLLISSAKAYAKAESRIIGTAYVKMAATFLSGSWRDYATQVTPPPVPRYANWPENLPDPDAVRNAWAKGHWPGNWGAKPDSPACRVPAEILQSWGVAK